jgi:hypothetical protein
MKDYLPTLIIAAVAGVILWKLWPQLTVKTPSVDELAGAIAAANVKAAADKAAADKAAADAAAAKK